MINMPVIARSEPIRLELEAPAPTPTPTPIAPAPIAKPSNVLERHKQFISKIDLLQACFVRSALPGFSDDEFSLHLQIAKIDKYVTDAGNQMYCSKAAVDKLSDALQRQAK